MTFLEKLSKLTSEQREKFNAVRDNAGLDAFLSESGLELTPEEKDEFMKYVASGKLPLSDEDLENVAAGYPRPDSPLYRRQIVANPGPKPDYEGRTQKQQSTPSQYQMPRPQGDPTNN